MGDGRVRVRTAGDGRGRQGKGEDGGGLWGTGEDGESDVSWCKTDWFGGVRFQLQPVPE